MVGSRSGWLPQWLALADVVQRRLVGGGLPSLQFGQRYA